MPTPPTVNPEMRSMNLAASVDWTATVDSLRLIRMPEMDDQERNAMRAAHHARMRRLMQMHRDMMRSMKS